DDYSPEQIGVAFDIGHATVEGAKAWPLNYARIKSHIDTIYVKEPSWNDNKLSWGPLGEGVVDKGFFKLIQQETFSGPISLHVEYLGHSDPSIGPAVLEAMKTNLDVLKANLI
ncbi:MAG: sugar phosphate isomerase/epimerase, partial [Verrucomicrobiota bacterium]